jgi:DNA-binding winged helix-turn-helix (wHTH) protein
MRVRFGEFTFDSARQVLLRGSEPVHLTPKTMRLLEILLERRGQLVSHDELTDLLWPDVIVGDASLKNTVAALRTSLGDDGRDPRLVVTVHKRGYRFVEPPGGPDGSLQEKAVAHLSHEGKWFPLVFGSNLVGRSSGCDVVLPHISVSRRHATIVFSAEGVTIEDLGSTNGTFVDDLRITCAASLGRHNAVSFGRVDTRFTSHSDGVSTVSWSTTGALRSTRTPVPL